MRVQVLGGVGLHGVPPGGWIRGAGAGDGERATGLAPGGRKEGARVRVGAAPGGGPGQLSRRHSVKSSPYSIHWSQWRQSEQCLGSSLLGLGLIEVGGGGLDDVGRRIQAAGRGVSGARAVCDSVCDFLEKVA